jgi:hypothetical protein
MHQTWKQRWHALTDGTPGRRFQDRYEAARKARQSGDWGHRLTRLLGLAVALVSFVIGVILAFIPGPAVVFFLLTGSLLASESRGLARLLDWGEVRLHSIGHWCRRHWRQLPIWGRAIVVVFLLSLSAASTYLSYRLVAG